ncbi:MULTISPECIES: response regulator [unclassified Butyrivibrio]|uniref:response regulator n=1 Tax=unclassified Butyrivibrio TaxID=2639466 RepID=UPI0003B400B6|nr:MULTISPECIES: response regulator [unclassified Butyrivibrio]SDB45315.1 two-component system, chemotaxis family, response regulator CheY [Butyrivibrio sp. INlla16]SEK66539.1 two-component system, chemotaxis family, response regulator CheY [Butyrivibrio sp. ob235]
MANILIVDDSRTSRRVLKDMLERNGHVVVAEATNGQEGFNDYGKYNPDIVTMDITMPVMDGIEGLKLIHKSYPDAKVVMITAAGQNEKVKESLENGAIEFITKPLDEDKVIAAIDKVMKK